MNPLQYTCFFYCAGICSASLAQPSSYLHLTDDNAWTSRNFFSVQRSMDDKSLQLPDIWNQHQFLKEHSDKSYLFPGVHYEAPQKLPLGISSGWVAGDVESSLVPNRHRQGFLSSIVIGYRFVPQQRYDLKELIKDTSDPDRNAL